MEDYKYARDVQKTAKTLIKKANARKYRSQKTLFTNATVLGMYGWHICSPVLIGLIIGHIMDKYLPLPPMSWMFNCVALGFVFGIYHANRWANKTGYKDTIKARKQQIQKNNGKIKQ